MSLLTSTALAYQMMIEEKLMTAMIYAEQRGQYFIASKYAHAHCLFMKVPDTKLPPLPVIQKGSQQDSIIAAYQTYYFNLLITICQTAADTLEQVRKTLRKQGQTGIPQIREAA